MAAGSFIGPSSIAETSSSTMKLSSSVVTTSSTPRRDFSSAGTSSNSAPAMQAAATIAMNNKPAGAAKPVPPCRPPIATAASAPAYSWPSAPMLYSRARNATAAASPVRISGVARVKVSVHAKREPNPPSSSSA